MTCTDDADGDADPEVDGEADGEEEGGVDVIGADGTGTDATTFALSVAVLACFAGWGVVAALRVRLARAPEPTP